MTRTKVTNKNVVASVSITEEQRKFIDSHPKFNFSKFVQIHLQDYCDLTYDLEKLKGGQFKQNNKNGKKTIKR